MQLSNSTKVVSLPSGCTKITRVAILRLPAALPIYLNTGKVAWNTGALSIFLSFSWSVWRYFWSPDLEWQSAAQTGSSYHICFYIIGIYLLSIGFAYSLLRTLCNREPSHGRYSRGWFGSHLAKWNLPRALLTIREGPEKAPMDCLSQNEEHQSMNVHIVASKTPPHVASLEPGTLSCSEVSALSFFCPQSVRSCTD